MVNPRKGHGGYAIIAATVLLLAAGVYYMGKKPEKNTGYVKSPQTVETVQNYENGNKSSNMLPALNSMPVKEWQPEYIGISDDMIGYIKNTILSSRSQARNPVHLAEGNMEICLDDDMKKAGISCSKNFVAENGQKKCTTDF